MKHLLSYDEFEQQTRALVEVAQWDNPKLKKIDKAFVSFSKGEEYEPQDLYEDIEEILAAHGIEISRQELEKVVDSCDKKIPRNNPRKQLLRCVLGHFRINLDEITK